MLKMPQEQPEAPAAQQSNQSSLPSTPAGTSKANPFSRISPKETDEVMTLQSPGPMSASPDGLATEMTPDIFEKRDSADLIGEKQEQGHVHEAQDQSPRERFDELPIEMISLTDRFVESLSARVYDTPPSIDRLSSLFQEFYIRASSHVETHISILASRARRKTSPAPVSSQPSNNTKYPFSLKSSSQKGDRVESGKIFAEQQMLTATEVAERRQMRKLLEFKRQALEEAIERRVCESVYDKIWRHRTTLDEVRDEKLRSKTASLAVVGFGLKDLGVDVAVSKGEIVESDDWLAPARQSLMQMDDVKFPLGKLQHLNAAHKAIVDSLTKVLPSTSSADEILPTLIYALVTSPPEKMNVVSNLSFIQRFRASSRIDGEAAYCLTNLEAAISFLENVDLNSSDEARNSSAPTACQSPNLQPSIDPTHIKSTSSTASSVKTGAVLNKHRDSSPSSRASTLLRPSAAGSPQNRLSSIFQPPAKALGAANDIVRNTADQGIKNISNTLDNSFKFLFGRLKEAQLKQGEGSEDTVGIVPKTLDDARRLVNAPVGIPDDFSNEEGIARDDSLVSDSSSTRLRLDDRLANLVAGRKPTGDRPIKRTDGVAETIDPTSSTPVSAFPPLNTQAQNPAFGSVKSFGNTLNPLNHIPGMIRGLSRSSTEPNSVVSGSGEKPSLTENAAGIPAENMAPPIKRFIELEDAAQLKVGDISELLDDYKRLASILNNLALA